jgi:hypothetical protein
MAEHKSNRGGREVPSCVLRNVVLSREDVEAVARRVVQLIQETDSGMSEQGLAGSGVRLVDAATVARVFGVERDWVYAHATELGAIRLGGEKGRLRFDLEALRGQMGPDGRESPMRHPRTSKSTARRQNGAAPRSTRKR